MAPPMAADGMTVDPDVGLIVDSAEAEQQSVALGPLVRGADVGYGPLVPDDLMDAAVVDARGGH